MLSVLQQLKIDPSKVPTTTPATPVAKKEPVVVASVLDQLKIATPQGTPEQLNVHALFKTQDVGETSIYYTAPETSDAVEAEPQATVEMAQPSRQKTVLEQLFPKSISTTFETADSRDTEAPGISLFGGQLRVKP